MKYSIPCTIYNNTLVVTNVLYNHVEIIEMLVDSYKIINNGEIRFYKLQKVKGNIELVGDVSHMFYNS